MRCREPALSLVLAIVALLGAIVLSPAVAVAEDAGPLMVVDVNSLGLAFVSINGTILGGERVECVGEPLYVYSYSPADLVPYLDTEAGTLLLVSPRDEPVNFTLTYVSLVSKPAGANAWVSQLHLPETALIILPEGYALQQVSPAPFQVTRTDGRVALLMPPGNVSLAYSLAAVTQTVQQTLTETPGGTGAQPQPGNTATVVSGGQAPGAERKQLVLIYVLIAVAAAAGILIVHLTLRRKRGEKPESYLDERDKAIISFLREKGPSTPSEIMAATGIPKSAFYRRVSRLEKLGLLESIDLGTKKVYRLKKT